MICHNIGHPSLGPCGLWETYSFNGEHSLKKSEILYSIKYLGLAVDELLLALWMIFWRGLVSFAVEPFDSCILKPLLPLTGILETVSIFITVSLGEVSCFSNLDYNRNSLNNSAEEI